MITRISMTRDQALQILDALDAHADIGLRANKAIEIILSCLSVDDSDASPGRVAGINKLRHETRNARVYKMRMNGMTYRSIAEIFKLSESRVRDICLRVQYQRNLIERKNAQVYLQQKYGLSPGDFIEVDPDTMLPKSGDQVI